MLIGALGNLQQILWLMPYSKYGFEFEVEDGRIGKYRGPVSTHQFRRDPLFILRSLRHDWQLQANTQPRGCTFARCQSHRRDSKPRQTNSVICACIADDNRLARARGHPPNVFTDDFYGRRLKSGLEAANRRPARALCDKLNEEFPRRFSRFAGDTIR